MQTINKRPIAEFNATIAAFDYQAVQVFNTYTDGFMPIRIGQNIKPKKYNLVMDFETQYDISRFLAEVMNRFILRIDDSYFYECCLENTPSVRQEGIHSFTLTIPLLVVQKGNERKVPLKKSENIVIIKGTYKTGVRYEITPNYNGEITVGGYTIRNTHAGKKIVIDGENMLIEEEGENKFSDAMFTKFPSLEPGNHIITVSNTNADAAMFYHPVYL